MSTPAHSTHEVNKINLNYARGHRDKTFRIAEIGRDSFPHCSVVNPLLLLLWSKKINGFPK